MNAENKISTERTFNLDKKIINGSSVPFQFKVDVEFKNHGKFIAEDGKGRNVCAYISNRGVRNKKINFLHLVLPSADKRLNSLQKSIIFAGNMDLPEVYKKTTGKIKNVCIVFDSKNILHVFFDDESGIYHYSSKSDKLKSSEWHEHKSDFIPETSLGDIACLPDGTILIYLLRDGQLIEKNGKKETLIAENNCRRPNVYIDSSGARHIAFERDRRIYYSCCSNGRSWKTASGENGDEMVAYFCSSWPSIAVDCHGAIVIAYQGEGKIDLCKNPGMYEKMRAGGGSTVSFAVFKNGKWTLKDYLQSKEILLKRRATASLDAGSCMPLFKNHMEELWHPSLTVDKHGVISMFFMNTARRHVFFSRFQGCDFGDFFEAAGAIDCPSRFLYTQKENRNGKTSFMFYAANQFYFDSLPVIDVDFKNKLLFLDNMELDIMEGIDHCIGKWEKSTHPLKFDFDKKISEEENILWAEVVKKNDLFEMHYMAAKGTKRNNWLPGRAISKDGVNWQIRKPFDLTKLTLDGKPFPTSFWRPVFVEDKKEKNSAHRFKGVLGMYEYIAGIEQRTWKSVVSSDALNWHLVTDAPDMLTGDISVTANIMIDEEDKDLERRFKVMMLMGSNSGRAATFFTSSDGIYWQGRTWLREDPDNITSPVSPWPTGEIIIDPDSAENPWEEEIHDAVIWRNEGILMAHYDAFYFHFNQHTNKALAISRDGEHFYRVKRGKINMPHGSCGEWDSGRDRTSRPIVVGDEMWLYYCGAPASYFASPENIDLNVDAWGGVPENSAELRPWHVGLARMRADGWGYIQRKRDCGVGILITIPFASKGEYLTLNGKGLDGVKVAVIDAERCKPVAGYEKEKSVFSSNDSIFSELKWSNKSRLPKGRIRLFIEINSYDAKIYSIKFKN